MLSMLANSWSSDWLKILQANRLKSHQLRRLSNKLRRCEVRIKVTFTWEVMHAVLFNH